MKSTYDARGHEGGTDGFAGGAEPIGARSAHGGFKRAPASPHAGANA
jgi:hypothetical protein